VQKPPNTFKKNNNSEEVHSEFVEEAINELLESNRIFEAPSRDDLHVISPLSVSVQPSGKRRLILDLRAVNACLYKRKVKFDDHKEALEYFTLNGFMTKFDLKSGYHHLDIFSQHRKYLRFCWTFKDGVQRFFHFNVLPFGLSSAPYIFTKLLRPLVKLWKGRGFHGLGLEETYEKAEYAAHHTPGDLLAAGFIITEERSVWQPIQIIEWLGLKWDATAGTISISDKHITKTTRLLDTAIKFPNMSARELSTIVGSIISMGPVLGRLARIMTRHCQITVAAAADWDTKHALDSYCLLEIQFWLQNLQLRLWGTCSRRKRAYLS
jgi:hypothetical protein